MHQKLSLLQELPEFFFFLFVNTKSGGREGLRYIHLKIEKINFIIHQKKVEVSIYDLNHQENKKKGLAKLKSKAAKKNNCRAIVCGGDGSILWMVNQIIQQNIDVLSVPIGVIPVGTGNDFSRVAGWGEQQTPLIGKKLETMKQLIGEWINAVVVDFDIWEIQFKVHQNGYFKVGKEGSSQFINQSQYRPSYKRSFTNYCGIGTDGRVGYHFDKYRTNYRFLNKVVYSFMGFIKMFQSTYTIHQLIQKMQIVLPEYEEQQKKRRMSETSAIKQYKHLTSQFQIKKQAQNRVIFDNTKQEFTLTSKYENIVALNIDSFMAGVNDIWTTDRTVTMYQKRFLSQKSNDGLLEFVCWNGELDLAVQRIFKNGSKLTQGPGPYHFTFKRNEKIDFYTYLQIDGQNYKVGHPKELIIRKSSLTKNGIIKVLKKKEKKVNRDYLQS